MFLLTSKNSFSVSVSKEDKRMYYSYRKHLEYKKLLQEKTKGIQHLQKKTQNPSYGKKRKVPLKEKKEKQ
jgi:hypothetical protein